MIGWSILLFVAGVSLILAEFIVPGLICGIVGSLFVIASGGLACYTYPQHILPIIAVEALGVIIALTSGMYILARTHLGNRLVLEDSQPAEAGWVASDSDTTLLGAEGEVFTTLRPAGTILVNGKRIDAVADGTLIEKSERIRVIEVHGSRVVVERVEPDRETA